MKLPRQTKINQCFKRYVNITSKLTSIYVFTVFKAPARTSNLFAPIMLLEGHEGELFTVDFHPEGQYLASSGFDRRICKYSPFQDFSTTILTLQSFGTFMVNAKICR